MSDKPLAEIGKIEVRVGKKTLSLTLDETRALMKALNGAIMDVPDLPGWYNFKYAAQVPDGTTTTSASADITPALTGTI